MSVIMVASKVYSKLCKLSSQHSPKKTTKCMNVSDNSTTNREPQIAGNIAVAIIDTYSS